MSWPRGFLGHLPEHLVAFAGYNRNPAQNATPACVWKAKPPSCFHSWWPVLLAETCNLADAGPIPGEDEPTPIPPANRGPAAAGKRLAAARRRGRSRFQVRP